MSEYFPKPYKSFDGNINVNVDLSKYATKTDLKNISHADTSSFALKSNLASLKTEVDKLVAKVNSIDTSAFVLKSKYDTNKSEI